MFRIENIRYVFLLLLFQLGWNIRFNIVGSITASEIFLLVYTFLYVWKDRLFYNYLFRKLTLLYVFLLLVQCIMEFVVGNSLNNAAKGIAITVVSFCHIYFLVKVFLRDRSLVFWSLAFSVIAMLFRGSNFETNASLEETLEGESATYLKFFLAPLLINVALAIACVMKGRWMFYLFFYLGLVFIVAGARSSGVMLILTGIVGWFVTSGRTINLNIVSSYAVISLLLGYGMYVIYVNNVVSGSIKSGNNVQLLRVENPYNPINLLLSGRTETFVGFQAFLDKPLTGWGAWKKDSELNYKYHRLTAKLKGKSFDYNLAKNRADVIPSHSVLVCYSMYYGIAAFVIMIFVFCSIVKYGIMDIVNKEPYMFAIVYFLINFIWHFIFSPMSHFRQTLPLDMAFIIVPILSKSEQK